MMGILQQLQRCFEKKEPSEKYSQKNEQNI